MLTELKDELNRTDQVVYAVANLAGCILILNTNENSGSIHTKTWYYKGMPYHGNKAIINRMLKGLDSSHTHNNWIVHIDDEDPGYHELTYGDNKFLQWYNKVL